MSADPCPLCGREKLKDRVQRPPPMTEDPSAYCLHMSHIYHDGEMPPCEAAGVEQLKRMRTMLGALKAWCSRNGHTYAEKLAMHGLGESVSPPSAE
jgi:hypothetical protein